MTFSSFPRNLKFFFFFFIFILWLVKYIHTGELISCQSESRLGYEKWRKEKEDFVLWNVCLVLSQHGASSFAHLCGGVVVCLLKAFHLEVHTQKKKEPCYLSLSLSLSLPCVYLTRMAGQTTHRRRLPWQRNNKPKNLPIPGTLRCLMCNHGTTAAAAFNTNRIRRAMFLLTESLISFYGLTRRETI